MNELTIEFKQAGKSKHLAELSEELKELIHFHCLDAPFPKVISIVGNSKKKTYEISIMKP